MPLATVDLAAYETTNVALRRWGDRDKASRLLERVLAIAEDGRLVRIDRPLAIEVEKLAFEYEISAYDAAYVAAARLLSAPLASCDVRDLINPGLAQLPTDLVR